MITIPVYDLLILPGVTFYFKKDAAEKWDMKPEKEGDEVLFLFEKEEKPIRELAAEDFYPYGVLGEIDQLDSDGTVRVRAKERVAVSDFEQQNGSVFASAVQAPEADDLPEEEEKQRFQMMKSSSAWLRTGVPVGRLGARLDHAVERALKMSCARCRIISA